MVYAFYISSIVLLCGRAPRVPLAEIRERALSPLTLCSAIQELERLQLLHPDDGRIHSLFEKLSARRRELVRVLLTLRARLTERPHLRALSTATQTLLDTLTGTPAQEPRDAFYGRGRLLPRLTLTLLVGPHLDAFDDWGEPGASARDQCVTLSRSGHEVPSAHVTAKIVAPDSRLLWRRNQPIKIRLNIPAGATPDGQRPVSADDVSTLTDIASAKASLTRAPPHTRQGRHTRHLTMRVTTYTLSGTLSADVILPVPTEGTTSEVPVRPRRITVTCEMSYEERLEGVSAGDRRRSAPFTREVEERLSSHAHLTLCDEFYTRVRELFASHAALVCRRTSLPPAVRAEWQLIHVLASETQILPEAFFRLLEDPDLVLGDAWRPQTLPARRSAFSAPTATAAGGGEPWCYVDTPDQRTLGILIGPCIVATRAHCVDSLQMVNVSAPDGHPQRAFLWAWDRGRDFALLKVGLDSVSWKNRPRPPDVPAPLSLDAAQCALSALLPRTRFYGLSSWRPSAPR